MKVLKKNSKDIETTSSDESYNVDDATDRLHEDVDHLTFFAAGREFESVYVNHRYTERERKILATYESLDYLPPHSKVYCDWLKRQPDRFEWDRWLMMGMIGFVVGVMGFLMHQLVDVISETKWNLADKMITNNNLGEAWIFVVGYSVVFVIAGTFIVVIIEPTAEGSGIPEVIGYLNGTIINHIFSLKTMIVKFFSCVFAVGSGLPVGPEGPVIHLGSMIGAGLSQLRSTTLNIDLPFFNRFRNSEDRRNFISAGAAAGVASAFGAPVGGLLFAMEEVSSFWNMKLSWQTFFCCMLSTFTTDLLNSAFTGFRYEGDFGLFKTNKYILFAVTKEIQLNIIGVIPAALLGVLGGIFGSLFTFLNLKIHRGRQLLLSKIHLKPMKDLLKMLEPIIIMVVFGTVIVVLPKAFPCTEYSCPVDESNNTLNCAFGVNSENEVELYTCPNSKVVNINGKLAKNGSYNQMATLLFLTGEEAIAHLFSRNTHFEFDLIPLAVVFAVYFLLSCWAAGTSISRGLVVPMIFIGGLYGRFVGRLMVEIFGIPSSTYWSWMDPGAFALLGSASFFGGVSRLTMSLTVIMVELTNDIQFLLLIMTAIMVAKWVGDFVTHPLYHALLEFKCIPFLDAEPIIIKNKTKNISLELFSVKQMMTHPVITIQSRESVAHIAELLSNTTHSGFPVVKDISPEFPNTFCGIITRNELDVLLLHSALFENKSDHLEEPELLGIDYKEFCQKNLNDSIRLKELLQIYTKQEQYKNLYINLIPYINKSALCIQENFSLHRAYLIFRSIGLRHLTVVNEFNQVIGTITRKDLMGFMLEERLHNVIKVPEATNFEKDDFSMFDIASGS